MMPVLKSEFRKLLTIRSTYIVTVLVMLLVGFIAFYVEGWRLSPKELSDSGLFMGDVTGALNLTVFAAVIAILLVTHEYRYNTIMHTLTSSNSRSKVLLAKLITVSCYALVLTVLIGVLSPLMSYLGVQAAGHSMAPQTIYYKDLIWRSLFYGWSSGAICLVLATLIRSQVGSIAALFIIPSAIEGLLSQLLKHNSVYLPFTAQGQVISQGPGFGGGTPLSPGKAALVFTAYLAVSGAVAWILFLRRDATSG